MIGQYETLQDARENAKPGQTIMARDARLPPSWRIMETHEAQNENRDTFRREGFIPVRGWTIWETVK